MAKTLNPVPAYSNDWRIVNAIPNPKRPGTACFDRYANLAASKTVAEAALKVGKGYRSEIGWCVARGFITLEAPNATSRATPDLADALDVLEAEASEAEASLRSITAEAVADAAE